MGGDDDDGDAIAETQETSSENLFQLLSTGIGTAVSQPHPCCHSISLLLLLLVSHSQLSAAACCLLLVVCLSASIPPYSPSRRLGPLR